MFSLIVGYLVIGLVIGALARLVVPGPQHIGLLLTILLGVVGAVVGGLIASALGLGTVLSFLASLAVAALLVYLVAGSSRAHTARW